MTATPEQGHNAEVYFDTKSGSHGWRCSCGRGSQGAILPLTVAEWAIESHRSEVMSATPAQDRLAEIRQRAEKATRGPWGWRGYVDGAIELRTLHSGGLRVITTMAPDPCSAIDADGDPVLLEDACAACKEMARRFIAGEDLEDGSKCEKPENLHTVWVWCPDTGTWGSCVPINKYATRDVPHRKDVGAVQHPDAEFIAHSRTDVDYLIGEVKRLRDALAHHVDTLITPATSALPATPDRGGEQ